MNEPIHTFEAGNFGATTAPLCKHCGLSEIATTHGWQGNPQALEANFIRDTMDLVGENRALKLQRDELLAALRELVEMNNEGQLTSATWEQASAAIARAEGRQP